MVLLLPSSQTFATCPIEAGGYLSLPLERMANAKRKLARDSSSRAAGRTAYARKKVSRADVDGQELLPGISNEVTMGIIALKLNWSTCNVLQKVSRGWRQAINNHAVYDAKTLSKSTEPFLVVLSFEDFSKLVMSLYSCRDHYFLRLPPIPFIPGMFADRDNIDCVCLEGRVYLWFRKMRAKRVQLYVLDLAGHKKWEKRKPVKYNGCSHGLGVLDGKIYKFRETSGGVLTSDNPFQREPLSMEEKVQELPVTEIYDPVHDAWSLITPAPPLSAVDPVHHLSLFSDWAQEKLAADPSKTFLNNGRYESYFSEWKQKRSQECSKTSTVDNASGNGMATQVYYSHSQSLSTLSDLSGMKSKEVLFFGGKLVTYEKYTTIDPNRPRLVGIQGYDVQTNMWKHWKSVSTNAQSLNVGHTFSIYGFEAFAAANNSLWAIVCGDDEREIGPNTLVQSMEVVDDDNVNILTWIDTGLTVGSRNRYGGGNTLRPIYL